MRHFDSDQELLKIRELRQNLSSFDLSLSFKDSVFARQLPIATATISATTAASSFLVLFSSAPVLTIVRR